MIVRCDDCGMWFEDVFRNTICPHEAFPANDGKNNFKVHDDAYLDKLPKYDPAERRAPPIGHLVSSFRVDFGVDVCISASDQRKLYELVSEIVLRPENQPLQGVHWLSGSGAMPKWSQRDAKFLGREIDPEAPEGGEPTFDDSVLYFESTARGFVSEKERLRHESNS
jgi:hypothetical protein